MSGTVRVFVRDENGWKPVRKPKGHRNPEWNNENDKMARKIRARQHDYEQMIQKIKGSAAGYHRPGSVG